MRPSTFRTSNLVPLHGQESEHEVNEHGNFMLQVVFALVSLLIIAAAIMKMEQRAEVEQLRREAVQARQEAAVAMKQAKLEVQAAKDEAQQLVAAARQEAEEAVELAQAETERRRKIEKTEPGQAFLALEKQKLEQALAEIRRRERVNLGLELFVDAKGEARIQDIVLIALHSDQSAFGSMAAARFKEACVLAREHYAGRDRREALGEAWHKQALEISGLKRDGRLPLHEEHRKWLANRVREMVGDINLECRTLHECARSALWDYYNENPGEVRDETVTAARVRYGRDAVAFSFAGHDPAKRASAMQWNAAAWRAQEEALNTYVFRVFEQLGAPLLRGE